MNAASALTINCPLITDHFALEKVAECISMDAEFFGGEAHVSVAVLQRLLYHFVPQLFNCLGHVCALPGWRSNGGVPVFHRDAVCGDAVIFRHFGGLPHHIAQLPHIAWPLAAAKSLHRLVRQLVARPDLAKEVPCQLPYT